MFDAIRDFTLALPDTEEGFPFGDDVLVFKVRGKMFLLVRLTEHPNPLSVKCVPERGEELCATYPCIVPGWHLNKKHWITVTNPEAIPAELLWELIRTSYELVQKRH